MHNAGSEMLEESEEMEEASQDDTEELSDLELADELEQMAEDISSEMETKMRAPGNMAEYVHNYAMKNDAADPRHSSKWDKKTCQSRWNAVQVLQSYPRARDETDWVRGN
ncbi:hypothetical protein PF005_g24133 [Phytophthora fragariae]|nr:hypothetical protein PF007_g18743 [Phytophthora fragariae]KAE9178301.1 hypothetical protein PF005_g24133 [Phytophthora fragariae]